MGKKITFLILVIIVIIGVLFSIKDKPIVEDSILYDNDSVAWNGEQKLETEKIQQDNIAIPCFDRLVLNANKREQKVNIYNPKENNCLIVFSLFVDEELVWKSEYCRPGNGFYDIVLDRELDVGIYHGNLLHECYTFNNQRLNSANVKIGVVVQ